MEPCHAYLVFNRQLHSYTNDIAEKGFGGDCANEWQHYKYLIIKLPYLSTICFNTVNPN